MKNLVFPLIMLVLAVPAGLYIADYLNPPPAVEGAKQAAAPAKTPLYLTLDPPFVVNFMHRGTMRYLQLSMDLMFHEQSLLDKVKERMPAIRNDLILLFSNQEFETLSSPEGKEALREEIMRAVHEALELEPGTLAQAQAQTGQVYFTNFVMQ